MFKFVSIATPTPAYSLVELGIYIGYINSHPFVDIESCFIIVIPDSKVGLCILQFAVGESSGKLYKNVRHANGTWVGWTLVANLRDS